MSTLPDFTGPGFFAGEAPDGLTTIAGTPTSAQVRVYWRDPADPQAPDALVASTQSAADGTWQITGLNPALRYVVRAQKSQFDDVTVVGAMPARSDVIAYVDYLEPTEEFDGLAGHVLLDSGLSPFTCQVIQPLPYGLSARIEGRKLLIEGVSSDAGLWESVVRVTASNGVWEDVPVEAQIQGPTDPHWDKVVSLLHFDGDLADGTGRAWESVGSSVVSSAESVFGGSSLHVPTTSGLVRAANSADFDFGSGDFTIEFFLRPTAVTDWAVYIDKRLSGSYFSPFTIQRYAKNNTIRFLSAYTAGSWSVIISAFHPPLNGWTHVVYQRRGGVFQAFLGGVQVGSFDGGGNSLLTNNATLNIGADGSNAAGMVGYIDELRITKGVARYTENFTPPDKPFLNR